MEEEAYILYDCGGIPTHEMKETNVGFLNGPDQIIPSNDIITWAADGAVKLRLENSGPASGVPISVPGRMKKIAMESPDLPALKKSDPKTGQEIVWSWSNYYQDVRTVAKAFIDFGLKKFDSVCMLGFELS
eukprot:TRINITY_DN10553_c2_g1_i1.p1 TRINITY_DN10553_c2_g1~~TRINITY_DN10553_c2_g1_i1.p1  ORF type:complete len:131 (-),score=21.28 TRINITY_DN10553_c2_g1_i1:14-406(-)